MRINYYIKKRIQQKTAKNKNHTIAGFRVMTS